jgi:1-acyl-sn-glycerol-3-phosphate acyltransferase
VDVAWSLRHLAGLRGVDWGARSLDDRLIGTISRAFAGIHDRYFHMDVRGWEHVPASPAVLVGNHSGFGVAELLMLLVAWERRFGDTRPRYALAHRWMFRTPFLRIIVPKIGGVPASWESAHRVLAAGHPLAVFPGGELESTRSFADRYKVQLHGRRGFVRLALEHEVPIVPFVTVGSHATMILPPGMHVLARVTGARRALGLEAVPLPLQVLVWLLASLALAEGTISGWLFLLLLLATPPLYPSKMTTVFGRPIAPAELRALPGADASSVEAVAYAHVETLMQAMMDALAAERRWVFG